VTPGIPRLFLRAFRRRCPWCGGGPVFRDWFHLRPACGACGLVLERGESDYWIGALGFHLILLELLFAGVFVVVAWRTWPDPPWALLQYGSAAVLVVGGIVGYPFAKLTWLAFDLAFRPPGAGDGAADPPGTGGPPA
jgi:uncharacterized protein (DUF983 family)